MKHLRPYQQAAIDATLRQLETYGSTVVVLPTGLGKTVYASKLISGWERGNCLFLAHTRELIEQAADKLGAELGYQPGVEMNVQAVETNTLWQGGMTVVGSVQTMYGDRRLEKYRTHPFGLIVVDECFPAGTLVDGRPIESFAVGDRVTAFDPVSGVLRPRTVQHVFRKPAPQSLVRITAGGRTVTATPNHPFLTERGWVDAGRIQVGEVLYRVRDDVHGHGRAAAATDTSGRAAGVLVLAAVPPELDEPAEAGRVCELPRVVRSDRQGGPREADGEQTGVLLAGLRGGVSCGHRVGNAGRDESQVRLGPDAGEEPDGQGGSAGQGVGVDAGDGPPAGVPGRERPRIDGSRGGSGGRDRPRPVRPEHARRPIAGVPHALQARPGRPGGEAGDRDRRREPQVSEGAGCRPAERGLLAGSRVDRVEVLQRGSVGGPDGLCPDGFVYNLEVEGEHTYLANGFAVHNCHHATASTYKKVVEFFQGINPGVKVVGITATPNRSDGTALGLMFESVAYQMSINDAVSQGWLVPVAQEYVVVDELEFDGIKTKKNEFGEADFNASQLEEMLTQEETLHKMAVPTLEKVGDRPTLVFTASVRHAHELAAVINRYRPESAAAVDGGTDKEKRKEIVRDFTAGRVQFLCNCAVLTEGFDAPNCAAIVMGRPTKSLSLYTQMLGRGLRPLPGTVDGVAEAFDRQMAILTGGKPNCLVLDFVGNSNHKLASAYDVLGGNYDAQTRELARRESTRERKDVGEVMEQAAALLAVERQWREREHIKARDVRYGSFAVDPFDGDAPEIAGSDYTGPARGTATDSQVRLLVNLGVAPKVAEGYSKRQAGAVIDSIAGTRCTVKQAATLRKYGIQTDGVGMDRASRIIDAIAANGWQRPEVIPG